MPRLGRAHAFAPCTSHAAQPVQIEIKVEKITGGGMKYILLKTMLAT